MLCPLLCRVAHVFSLCVTLQQWVGIANKLQAAVKQHGYRESLCNPRLSEASKLEMTGFCCSDGHSAAQGRRADIQAHGHRARAVVGRLALGTGAAFSIAHCIHPIKH